jgi:hypothetical protein
MRSSSAGKPKPNRCVHVDAIPLLGTGKTDLRAIKAPAEEGMKVGCCSEE